MSHENFEVIDLTSLFTLANHSSIANEIICIDSDESSKIEAKSKDRSSNTNNLQLLKQKKRGLKKVIKHQGIPLKFGHCPICWNKLGINPLVSTKCGHVYCLKCLEKALQLLKQCPTCRYKLLGKNAYHPLYLSSD